MTNCSCTHLSVMLVFIKYYYTTEYKKSNLEEQNFEEVWR